MFESVRPYKKVMSILCLVMLLTGTWAVLAQGQDSRSDEDKARFLEQRIREPERFLQYPTIMSAGSVDTASLFIWQIEAVEGGMTSYAGGRVPLIMDSVGRPHIAYVHPDLGELRHAYHDSVTWQIETVDDQFYPLHPASALDTHDRPHIAYQISGGGALKYAHYDGFTWQIETVDTSTAVHWTEPPVLAVDNAGHPHIGYSTFYDVKYAYYNGSSWQIEAVDTSSLSIDVDSLKVDSANRPHLTYHMGGSLYYAHRDGSAWEHEWVEAVDRCVGSSLALDTLDRPHISCRGQDGGRIYIQYAYYDGLVWQAEVAEDIEFFSSDTSLALDAAGQPHISYCHGSSNYIRYAWRSGSSWKTGTVDTVSAQTHPSLAVDKSGQPRIAYLDGGQVQYAVLGSDASLWSKLAFASLRDKKDWELYTADADGSSLVRLTDNWDNDSTPEFNPGATQIAFRSDRDHNQEIYRMEADGSEQTRLTEIDADDYQPTWSPNGTQLAFYSYRYGNAEIYTMNANGSNQLQLTYDPAWDGHPTWSPDGSRIAFVSERSGQEELWVMNADGSNQQQLTSGLSYAAFPDWSPDGTRIVFNDDANGDGWLDIALINADGTGLTHPLDSSPSLYDYLAPAWMPHGQALTFGKVQWIEYAGNWYWVDSYLVTLNLVDETTSALTDSGLDWWPDWQTTDVSIPSSQVSPLPTWSGGVFPVQWSGIDAGPAGVGTYDVQVRDGSGGTWTDWLLDTQRTADFFTGQDGHTYYFRSRARDFAYNLEPYPEGDGDASTTVDAAPPSSSASSPGQATALSFPVTWSGSDAGSGLASYDVQVREGVAGAWADWLVGTTATSAFFRGELGHTYYFQSRAQDKMGNVEAYPGGDGDTVTHTPEYAVSGRILGTRGDPVALATVEALPPALNKAVSQPGGVFDLYFDQEGSCDIKALQDSFGPLPPMKGVPVGAASPPVNLYLPPADDQISDGGFETGTLATWNPAGDLTPVLTDTAHTGDWAVLFGGPIPPPQVAATPPFSVSTVLTGAGGELSVPVVAVVVPPAAVSGTTTFTLTSVPTTTALPQNIQDVGPRFALTAVLSGGTAITTTQQAMTLTVSYDDGAWQAAQVAAEESLALWQYDAQEASWLPLSGTPNTVSNTVTVMTDHLGLFALLGASYTGPWQGTLSQEVTLPPPSELSTLSLLYRVESADPLSDSLSVVLSDVTQSISFTLPLTTSSWTHSWWDLSSWNGPTVTLELAWSQGTREHLASVILDEVTLGSVTRGSYPTYLPVVVRAGP